MSIACYLDTPMSYMKLLYLNTKDSPLSVVAWNLIFNQASEPTLVEIHTRPLGRTQ